MPTTYERAPKAIEALVQHALEKYHPELHKMGVTIDVMLARGQDKDEFDCHTMKSRGYPIYAKTQITALADRARGIGDAKLTIDAYDWDKFSDRQKAALLDHELEHLDLALTKPTKKNGYDDSPKRDDLGRPKLKMRPHTWELVGFKDVAERHGDQSFEAKQFSAFRDQFGQLNMFGPSVLQIAEKSVNGTAKKVPASQKSKACRNRHHAACKSDGCLCDCGHKGESAHA